MSYYKLTYNNLIDYGQTANELIEKILGGLDGKRISNCKLLGNQILKFDVKKIGSKLKEAIEGMYEFFYESYKSFFCSVCDADSNQFISFES